MYTLVLTYGLNPLNGLKVLVKSSHQRAWSEWLAQWRQQRQKGGPFLPRLQISLGTLMPAEADHLTRLEVLTRLKFFVAIETEGAGQPLPALTSGRTSAIQVYQHMQGDEQYKAEIVRFQVGQRRRWRRR
ncbi:MAG: hypothetical protein NW237_06060 [Cyanobacteriota bacterium]|nr:hypothetical protein [Cyanobacteriota bacterium]